MNDIWQAAPPQTFTALPNGFSKLTRAAFNTLDGYLYLVGTKMVLTDEVDDLECPRCEFDSLEEFEDWLIASVADWLAEGKNDPMVEALEEQLNVPV